MSYNYYFSLASFIFLIFVLFCVAFKYMEKTHRNTCFIRLTVALLFASLFDVLGVVAYDNITPKNIMLVMIAYGLNFFSMTATVFCYGLYIESFVDEKCEKRVAIRVINNGIFVAYGVLHLLNPFIHCFYCFDDQCVYYHMPLYNMIFIVPVYFMIYGVILLCKNRKFLSVRQLISMLTFSLLIVLASTLQFWIFPGMLISIFAGTCGFIIIFFFLQTPDYKILLDTMDDLKKAEAVAQEERIKAYAANQAKSSFLANVSHEIRTPINAVLGMNEMIIRETNENMIREYAMDVNAAGKSLLAIINDILDISKIEAGKMEINCAEYEIVSLLEDVVNMTNIRAKKKKLEFIADIDSSLPVRMYGDDLRIKQIILNLLSNGVKYTNEGSVTLKIHGEKEEGGEYIILHISVCDTGIGIKPEEQDNLFKAFQRLDEATNRKVEGTGLGMSIANEMLRLMDSKIYFESEYGKGTNFYFDLRQKIVDSTEIGEFDMNAKNQEKVYLKNAGFTAPNSKILVVDDNSINRKVLIGFLRTVGCQVSEASSGFECLDIIKEEHFDLILLDHLMPELDGVGTLEKIKSEENKCMDTPVIICTANAVSGMKESFLATGFNGFISKPVDSKVLYKVLEEQLPKDQIVEGQVEIGVVSAEPEEELPDLDNFDFRYAKLCLGSVSVIKSVASDFYDQTFRIVDALEGYATDLDNPDNMSRYRTDVHALKSTSRMVGEINLSGLAKTSEFAAKESDKETVLKLHPMILKEIDVARADLEIMFPEKTKEPENATKEQIELSKLKELLDRLQNALDARNVKEQDAIALELSNYSYDAKLSDKIEELITNIKILKMLKASMTLAEIKKIVEEM